MRLNSQLNFEAPVTLFVPCDRRLCKESLGGQIRATIPPPPMTNKFPGTSKAISKRPDADIVGFPFRLQVFIPQDKKSIELSCFGSPPLPIDAQGCNPVNSKVFQNVTEKSHGAGSCSETRERKGGKPPLDLWDEVVEDPLKQGMWVREVVVGKRVKGLFLVKEKKLLQGKTGRPYALLMLADKTGEVEARIWDRVEELEKRFEVGDLVSVSGDASEYQGAVQVRIQDLENHGSLSEEELEEFVPEYFARKAASEKRLKELRDMVGEIQDEDLRLLVLNLLDDPQLKTKWITTPAAKRLHHARLGGLLEHTLSVVKLAAAVCDHYEVLDKDILIAGAALHDIGKLRELKEPWKPEYTTEGRLLGHLIMGLEMLDEALRKHPNVSPIKVLVLKHMLASHHGALEFGSPKRPKVPEALVLYMLDDLDAKLDAFISHLSTADGIDRDGWTRYHPLLERYLFGGWSKEKNYEREKGKNWGEDSEDPYLGADLGEGEGASREPSNPGDS